VAARGRGSVDEHRRRVVRRRPDRRPDRRAGGGDRRRAPRPEHDHEGHEHPRYETWSWTGDAPLDGAGLVDALPALPDGIVRAKGLLHLREDPARRYLLQLVGRRYTIEAQRAWGDAAPRSRVVVIGLAGSVDERALDATMARLSAPSAGG
jgi:G3E family GTPase